MAGLMGQDASLSFILVNYEYQSMKQAPTLRPQPISRIRAWGGNSDDVFDPFDNAALDHDSHRVVDHQPFGPVEVHGFTPR